MGVGWFARREKPAGQALACVNCKSFQELCIFLEAREALGAKYKDSSLCSE